MALSVSQLTRPVPRSEVVQLVMSLLDGAGFTASSWQSGSKQRTFIELASLVWADLSHAVRFITEALYNELATGQLLTEFSKSHYDNDRIEAVTTQGTIMLTCAAGAGPYTIAVGELVVADATNDYTYRNVTGGVLASGGTLELTFEAETAGSLRNVADNTITVEKTVPAGVTVNNPPDPSTWITRSGSDEESDASLRLRNRSKWGTLNQISLPKSGILFLMLSVPGVARAEVDDTNPDGPGTFTAYIAGATGVSGGGEVTAAQAVLDSKRSVNSIGTATAAAGTNQDFAGTIYVQSALNTTAFRALIKAKIKAYVDSLPIGGVNKGAIVNQMPYSEVLDVITSIAGVEKVTLTTPSTNVGVSPYGILTTDVATSMGGLTFTSV